MKGLLNRVTAMVFTILMVISSIPSTTIAVDSKKLTSAPAEVGSAVSGVAGDSDIFSDHVAANTIAVDKSSYTIGESIYVTTDADLSKYPNAWVGLFRNDVAVSADKYIYWYGFKGGLKPYGTYDLFAVGNYEPSNNSYAQPELYGGTFKVVLLVQMMHLPCSALLPSQ